MSGIFNGTSKYGIWKFLLLIIFIFKGLFVYAQSMTVSSGKILETDLFFERFYSKNGLPDDRIRSIFQDHNGFLWIGTMNGVARYDGYTFKNYYKTRLPNSISGNWAYAICEDSNNNIWIGTREGLNKFDKEKSTFESFVNNKNNSKTINSNVINALQFDKRGLLWIGTPQGLNRFNPTTKSFKRFNSYPFNTNVCSIISSKGDFIWIATRDGVVHYNTKTNKYNFFKIIVKSNPYGDKFWSMLEDQNDLYLTTGGDGLVKLPYNVKTNSYNSFQYVNNFKGGNISNTEVFSICKSSNGDFWLGTTGLGIAKIEKINTPEKKITFYKNNPLNSQSISNNQVYKLFIDRSNVLWCGTDEGLNKLDLYLLPFQYYTFTDKSKKDQVRSLYSTDGKTVWLGTTKSGIVKHNISSGEGKSVNFNSKSDNSNRSLLINGNDVWNGTLAGAIKLNQSLTENKNTIEGHAVFTFIKDSKGNIWAGTNNGLYKIKPDGSRVNYLSNVSTASTTAPSFIRSLYEDHKGNIWIGSENGPLVFFDPKSDKFKSLSTIKGGASLFSSIIFSIAESPNNFIWVGSESGLNKITFINGKCTVKNYTEESGLPDKSVNSILPDSKGNLWLGTIKGLTKFNIKSESFQNYLNNISFNPNSCQKVSNHCFLYGSYEGFVLFDPLTVTCDFKVPQVVISDLKLSNKSVGIGEEINGDVILDKDICYTKEIEIHYGNQFTLEFTGLHFSNPENNLYAYKLDGFNDEWTYTNAKNRSATYTNLDSGTYTFLVKSSNYSGKWNDKPQKLTITILSPLWKTWWALLIYFIIFMVLLRVFLKYMLIQAKQRNQIRFEQKEKEQLKNLNQMKVRFFTDISHEFRTPLSLIVGPTEDLLNSEETTETVKNKVKLIYHVS
jgi:ligand-binding sensor domain-containing protein